MFLSIGVDNFELMLSVTWEEARALKRASRWVLPDSNSFVLLGTPTNPLITLRFHKGKIYSNLNAPKILNGHNISLADRDAIRKAIDTLQLITDKITPRLNWQEAQISKVHVTLCVEVSDMEAFASLCKAPRGYWIYDAFWPNGYINAKRKDQPTNFYDKAEDYRDSTGGPLPRQIADSMDSLSSSLFRFEARLNQKVLSELRKHGGWNGLSFLASDLYGPGFASALKFLQWRFKQQFVPPKLRLPPLPSKSSARAYALHNTRATANENPAGLLERAVADHKAGVISKAMLHNELTRIRQVELNGKGLWLINLVNSEIEKQIQEILVAISGDLETAELEHAAREPGLDKLLPRNALRKRSGQTR